MEGTWHRSPPPRSKKSAALTNLKGLPYHEQLQQQHQQKQQGLLLLLDLTFLAWPPPDWLWGWGWPVDIEAAETEAGRWAWGRAPEPSGGRPRWLSLLVASCAILTMPEPWLGLTGLIAMSSMAMLSLMCTWNPKDLYKHRSEHLILFLPAKR